MTGSIKIWISARALAILQSLIFICAANGAPVLLARLLAEPASAARATAAITTFRILYRLGPSLFSNRSVGDCNPVASHVFVSGGGRGAVTRWRRRVCSIAERRLLNLALN